MYRTTGSKVQSRQNRWSMEATDSKITSTRVFRREVKKAVLEIKFSIKDKVCAKVRKKCRVVRRQSERQD